MGQKSWYGIYKNDATHRIPDPSPGKKESRLRWVIFFKYPKFDIFASFYILSFKFAFFLQTKNQKRSGPHCIHNSAIKPATGSVSQLRRIDIKLQVKLFLKVSVQAARQKK